MDLVLIFAADLLPKLVGKVVELSETAAEFPLIVNVALPAHELQTARVRD